jgi:hypothetical protein
VQIETRVERCLFFGPCETRGSTDALDGWPLTATLGLGEAGQRSPMDVYVERDLPGWQITGFLRDAGSQKRRKFRPEPPWA